MRLLDARVERREGAVRIVGTVERELSRERLEPYIDYQVDDPSLVGTPADALAAALLVPSMRSGEGLEVLPPVSPRLCVNLPRVQDIFHAWWPHQLSRVPIHLSPDRQDAARVPMRALTCFSGGVDSFYSLLKHRRGFGTLLAPLTHVVFMRGVETRLERIKDVAQTERWIRQVAADSGVECILGETDVRTSLQGPDEYIHWENHYVGSVLAAVALGLSEGFSYACIPSAGFSYTHIVPHGTSPLTDEMFSTERLQVIHDGSEATRPWKIARIIEWDPDLVLNHLRVCVWNYGGAFNCGKCYKYVRTAVTLRILGVWHRARTFDNRSSGHWEHFIAQDHAALIEDNLHFARHYGAERELISMLVRALRRRRRRDFVVGLLNNPPLQRLLPAATRVRQLTDRWQRRRVRAVLAAEMRAVPAAKPAPDGSRP